MNHLYGASRIVRFVGVLLLPTLIFAQDMKSFTLELALEIAMKESPRIRAAEKEVSAVRGRGWTTWWLPNPSFGVEYEGIPSGRGLNAFGERRLTLTQSIDFPTNMLFKKKLADQDVNVFRMQLEQTRLEVAADVKVAYAMLLARRDQFRLAQENLRLAQEFLDKAQTRYDVGEAPQLEVVRARVNATQAENDMDQAQAALTSAQAALNALLARPAEAPVNPVDSLAYRPFRYALSELKARSFESHPRLRAAEYQVSMAQQVRNLAWGSFLPNIELSAFQQTLEGNPNFYGVQFGLSLPLWFPFRQRGAIQEARGWLNASQWRKQNERHLLDADIESAYSAVLASQQQVERYIETLLAQAEEVYRIALRSYEEGEVGYLQLLEAQQTLIDVRRGYIDALAAYQAALAELERATGIDLD